MQNELVKLAMGKLIFIVSPKSSLPTNSSVVQQNTQWRPLVPPFEEERASGKNMPTSF
jgi:hypothetical protein